MQTFEAVHPTIEGFFATREDGVRIFVIDGGWIEAAPFEALYRHTPNHEQHGADGKTEGAQPSGNDREIPTCTMERGGNNGETQAAQAGGTTREIPAASPRGKRNHPAVREGEYPYGTTIESAILGMLAETPGMTAPKVYEKILTVGFPAAEDDAILLQLHRMWQADKLERDHKKRYYVKGHIETQCAG